ncbi:MAG: TetR/AcrR family transcriptional regulator, partial [Solirubrobacteraceae bacterium]
MLADQRERLQAAAIESIAEHACSEVSVRALTARAGVSKRSFYELFPHKQDLFLATLDQALDRRIARIDAACARADGLDARLRAFCESALIDVLERPREARLLMLEAFDLTGPAVARGHAGHARMVRLLARILHAGAGAPVPALEVR